MAGGRIVYASDEYQGQDAELPETSVAWSPVAAYGGYHRAPQAPAGVRQGQAFAEAAADSAEQTAWRDRGELVAQHDIGLDAD